MPVGSMRTSLWGQVGIDFAVTEEGKVHITFDLIGKHFVGADFDAAQQEEFAQYYVAACHQAKVNAAQARPADGMNAVERAARDLTGIPDNL
jgi:hypothetical protein